jgi:hypothetical protein
MMDRVRKLAEEIFTDERPMIKISDTEIELDLEQGKNCQKKITVESGNETEIRGRVTVYHDRARCIQSDFIGKKQELVFEFTSCGLKEGDIIEDRIYLFTNGGEYQIPFRIKIVPRMVKTSAGNIRTLEEFVKLAKNSWKEAVQIFKSREFCDIFKLGFRDKILCEQMQKVPFTDQNLEEFLIGVGKKEKMNFYIEEEGMIYEHTDRPFAEQFILHRDNWGYADLRLEADQPWIQFVKEIYTTEEFEGRTLAIPYKILPAHCHGGNNFGKIKINLPYEVLEYEIVLEGKPGKQEEKDNRKKQQTAKKQLTELYISYRLHRISIEEWLLKSYEKIEILEETEGITIWNQLGKAQLLIADKKVEDAKYILSKYKKEIEKEDAELFCYEQYLSALCTEDGEGTRAAAESIRNCYENGNDSFKILWMLLHIDSRYDLNVSQKYHHIREKILEGCCSPAIYYEAFQIIKEHPSVLKELEKPDLRILLWGCKKKEMTADLARRAAELSFRMRSFDSGVYRILTGIYRVFPKQEILNSICSLLIKGNKTENQYFQWYEAGIEKDIRLTRLFEYYMYSIEETEMKLLPKQVYLYFEYHNELNDRKKAFLYANILSHREEISGIYNQYLPAMHAFVLEQLMKGNVSRNIALLYEVLPPVRVLDEDLAQKMLEVYTRYEFCCKNSKIRNVIVIQPELTEVMNFPLKEERVQISLVGNQPIILLQDYEDNKYAGTIPYTMERIMRNKEYVDKCCKLRENGLYSLLKAAELEENIHAAKKLCLKEEIRQDYKKILEERMLYAYDSEGTVPEHIDEIQIENLKPSERSRYIEAVIEAGRYEEAFEYIELYGSKNIGNELMLKMCSGYLKEAEPGENALLITLCKDAWRRGWYDEVTLEYVSRYSKDILEQKMDLWNLVKEMEVPAEELEENILVHKIFVGDEETDITKVYARYIQREHNPEISRAYCNLWSYEYLIKGFQLKELNFQYLLKEGRSKISRLALIQYYSRKNQLTAGEKQWCEERISEFAKKKIVMRCFLRFKSPITLPYQFQDKTVVEYRGEWREVYIHYRRQDNLTGCDAESFVTEPMRQIAEGIFVKEFILFFGEKIEYCITEDEKMPEEKQLLRKEFHEVRGEELESRFCMMNRLLDKRQMGDYEGAIRLMKEYLEWEYITENMFTSIE